jgi:hypothetical protein
MKYKKERFLSAYLCWFEGREFQYQTYSRLSIYAEDAFKKSTVQIKIAEIKS